jgi:thiamine pyrophosphate-dependent acetolactate synthase large subunit-like protein
VTVATRNGARVLVDALHERGVEYLFGVPGHGAYPIYGALNDVPAVQPIVGRNEQGAAFIADGWSWITNRVAVCTSVPQAGLTNSATGLLQATLDGERMLFLLEEEPGHRDVLRSVAIHYERAARAEDIRPAFHRLMDLLETGRPGGAALEVPSWVLSAPAEFTVSSPVASTPASAVASGLDEAADLLSRAKRPAIVAGRPIVAAGAEAHLLRLAERLQAPVFAHQNAKGVIPEDHPLALGYTWSPKTLGEELLRSADVVLAVGPRDAAAVGTREPEQLAQQLIHLDWDDAQQGADQPARLRLAGHIGASLAALADAVTSRTTAAFPSDQLVAIRQGPWRYAEQRIPWAVSFFRDLQDALPRDAMFFTDSMVGLWIFRLLEAYGPRSFRFGWGNGTGTLGYALPASVGAKLADPSREAIVIAGDGAFLYNPQELATMLRYRQKLTVVVCNDNCYGAVRDNTAEQFGKAIGHELVNPDFIRLAEAFDMRAVRLGAPDEIGTALRSALAADRSTLIEVPLELRPGRY